MYRVLIIHHPYTSVEYDRNINNAMHRMEDILTANVYNNTHSVYIIDDSTNTIVAYCLKNVVKNEKKRG